MRITYSVLALFAPVALLFASCAAPTSERASLDTKSATGATECKHWSGQVGTGYSGPEPERAEDETKATRYIRCSEALYVERLGTNGFSEPQIEEKFNACVEMNGSGVRKNNQLVQYIGGTVKVVPEIRTAHNQVLQEGYTLACDPMHKRKWVYSQGAKRCMRCDDTGGAIKGACRFDVFVGPGVNWSEEQITHYSAPQYYLNILANSRMLVFDDSEDWDAARCSSEAASRTNDTGIATEPERVANLLGNNCLKLSKQATNDSRQYAYSFELGDAAECRENTECFGISVAGVRVQKGTVASQSDFTSPTPEGPCRSVDSGFNIALSNPNDPNKVRSVRLHLVSKAQSGQQTGREETIDLRCDLESGQCNPLSS